MSAESKQAKRKKSAEAITRPGKGPWYDWLDSSEGQQATKQEDCLLRGNYLENRLWRAFIAGMKAGFEQGGIRSTTQTKVWACKSNPTPRLPSR